MSTATFQERVSEVHQSWLERREMMVVAFSNDFASQADLLLTMYDWATDAIGAIRHVYGDDNAATLSPKPARCEDACFRVAIGPGHSITFGLLQTRGIGHAGWRVRAITTSAEGEPVVLAPKRNASSWTRKGLEDALLGLITSYERHQVIGR